jgi:hypothetical protein
MKKPTIQCISDNLRGILISLIVAIVIVLSIAFGCSVKINIDAMNTFDEVSNEIKQIARYNRYYREHDTAIALNDYYLEER